MLHHEAPLLFSVITAFRHYLFLKDSNMTPSFSGEIIEIIEIASNRKQSQLKKVVAFVLEKARLFSLYSPQKNAS
ncbi:MAG: hypothetical protein KBT41_01920 [bacterium]|nr:hypothetical protein [Candidatus Colousia faecequi]